MKSKSLLLLSIIPLLLIMPNLAYGDEFYIEIDRYGYTTNDSIIITGSVNEYQEDFALVMFILNPDRVTEEGTVMATVNADKTFEISFTARVWEFPINGTYTINALYGNPDNYAKTILEYNTSFVPEETIQIQIDQPEFNYGSSVFVNGTVTEILTGYDVDVSVINPNGDTAYTNTIQPNIDLTFDFSFDIDGVLFEDKGIYIVDITYGDGHTSISFGTPLIEFYVVTDKPEYFIGETYIFSGKAGGVSSQYVTTITYTPNGDRYGGGSMLWLDADNVFFYEDIISENSEFGIYEIIVYYDGDTVQTVFEIIPSNLNIETDKETYYKNDRIQVNGTITTFDPTGDLMVDWAMYSGSDMVLDSRNDADVVNNDGTFQFIISTANRPALWTCTCDMTLQVTIQNYTGTTNFQYINEINMTNQALYNHIMVLYEKLDTMLSSQDTLYDVIDSQDEIGYITTP